MDRKVKWRTFWLAVLSVLAISTLVPSLVPSESMPPWFSRFFHKKVQLGLDLQGGLHITYSLDLDKAVEDKATEIRRDLTTQLEDMKIEGTVTTPLKPRGAVYVTVKNDADLAKVSARGQSTSFLGTYDDVLVAADCPAEMSKALCMRVSSDYAERIKKSALEQAINTIRERINQRGVAEPSVVSKGDQIIVELPGLDQESIKRVKNLIQRTAKLEFKMVAEDSQYMKDVLDHIDPLNESAAEDMLDRYLGKEPKANELGIGGTVDIWTHEESGRRFNDAFIFARDIKKWIPKAEARSRGCWSPNKPEREGMVECTISGRSRIEEYLAELAKTDAKFKLSDEFEIGFEYVRPARKEDTTPPYWRTYHLKRAVELGGAAIADTRVTYNETTNRPEVLINFTRYGGRRFGEVTSQNVGKKFAIILDNKIASAPSIRQAITQGSAVITLGGSNPKESQQEAEDLVDVLRTGSLPAPLREDSASEVGPLLGGDAIEKAKVAFGLGSLLVVLIMVTYYRMSGVISIIALAFNLTFMMAILAAFQATLTLPGIAAIVLTVGMAVDANIIIYERIREELRAGKSVRGAVDAGFARGLAAIIDGNLTTGVAAYVLYQYGSGPIKGFAVMLLIGIVCTLFTATWCTRLFFEYYVGRGKSRTLAI